ncbi:lysine 5,6-aminomutase reactivase subunit KamB [Alkaliphilus peptidifermentans]|uniref:Uncharacterized protein n=1 Tax=Alkaliphilus peptidifermentans DSM 18978 TaxID=1120976 RepID=A0A1G5KIY7_9FIRM|nr:hypothetical protein [Alkaliphilus peptidifermentans]SCY99909.1 hypothetical protein SAMN03080606_03489 [Alkaliphilus peptidifermentans DSM 18978]
MLLLTHLDEGLQTISVVGMAKNSGKTVTLNRLIEEAAESNTPIGLTSTGRDGEKIDIITLTEKPTVFVYEGTIVATAKETLLNSEVKLEILEVTNFNTPLGTVVIARALNNGFVEIAGPDTNSQIKDVASKMRYYGAKLVIVDGAINRRTVAAPSITDATILAAGAVISRDINRAVEETQHQVNLFNLEEIDKGIRHLVNSIFEEKKYAIIDKQGETTLMDIPTSLSNGRIIGGYINEGTSYVIISGSLVGKTLQDIMAASYFYKEVIFVVEDATKIFISPREWRLMKKRGLKVRVLNKINTLAVTINPTSPYGYGFEPQEFLKMMKETMFPLPVVDVMMEDN